MIRKKGIALLAAAGLALAAYAQQPAIQVNSGFGVPEKVKCLITPAEKQRITTMLADSIRSLQLRKILPPANAKVQQVLFDWPLRQAAGLNEPGYYVIGNYIDNDPAKPNHIRDYNCGARTYDLESGGHNGTDIGIFPFAWQKMADNAVEVIAAADGVIIGKNEGNYDQSCVWENVTTIENGVYIRHADGSVAWYVHMKAGSITTKPVGATITKGEYLGVVGSSGFSSGPHLHFEVHDASNAVIDPWAGPCNIFNGNTSWWAAQQPYYLPTLCKVVTQSAVSTGTCAYDEVSNIKNVFRPGETVYCIAYFRDLVIGNTANFRVYTPTSGLYASFDLVPQSNNSAAYGYIYFGAPNIVGAWRIEVTFAGKTTSYSFTVANAVPAGITIDPLTNLAPCAGQAITVNFKTTGTFNAGNIFTAYLSNAFGNFTSDIVLGTTTTGTTINAVIPPNTPSGVGYKIAIKSSNPVLVTNTSTGSMVINNVPTPTITPVSSTAFCPGAQVVLNSSSSTGNQWYKDGVIINGATASGYTATTAGVYTVQAKAGNCSATSTGTTVTINAIAATPVITPGSSTTFCSGGSVALTSSAASTYQWYKDGVAIANAVNAVYNATIAGKYKVTVSNASGCLATAAETTVTVNALPAVPVITAGSPLTFCAGGTVTLTSSSATGNQWFKDGAAITSAVNNTYTANASGTYAVMVTNAGTCTATSVNTLVTVNALPAVPLITAGTNTAFCAGGNVVLTSSASTGNQWLKDGVALAGAVNATYTAVAAGAYTVRITDVAGCSAMSAATTVTVNIAPPKPVITRSNGDLSSDAATGNQWFAEGVAIAGATNQTFRPAASGNYSVRVTQNGCNSLPSDNYYFLITAITDPNALESKVILFPNPVDDQLYITINAIASLQVQLYDIAGKQLKVTRLTPGTHAISMDKLLKGVYVLLLTDERTKQSWRKLLFKK